MDPDQIAHLCQFVGYGTPGAPLVFLGIEEKGRNPADYPGDIEARVEHYVAPVMDLMHAHALLYQHGDQPPAPNPFDALPGRRPVQQWTTAAYFALALLEPLHLADPAMTPDEYWRERLGRPHGQTLLAECYPVPRPNMGVAIDGYDPHEVWVEQRLPILNAFFQQHPPQFAVVYGTNAHAMVEPLFGAPAGNGWIDVNALVNGLPRVAGDACVTQNGVVVCRTPFFGSWGRFNRQCIPFLAGQMHDLHPDL